MNRPVHIGRILLFLAAFATSLSQMHAQAPITIRGGNPSITITTGVAGGQPTPVVNTAINLDYRRRTVPTKITVGSICPGQSFTLKVLATGVPVGTPAPEVTLTSGMLPADFITNIPAGSSARQRCTLRYTASSTFSQGNSVEFGNDIHVITYTLVTQ